MTRKKAVALLVLVLVVCGAVYAWRQHEAAVAEAGKVLSLSGNVDVREVSVAFRESDRIAELYIDAGDTVKQGQPLGRLDDAELKIAIRKARSDVAAQQAAVDKLHNGSRPEDIEQARARVRQAEAADKNAAGVYARQQAIYDEAGAISRQELDNARDDAEAKAAAVQEARQALQEAVAGARVEDVQAAEAQLQSLKDALAQQEYVLSQYELVAPSDGVIRSRLLEPGDMASPSAPVFKLSLLDRKWVRVYVTETDLGKVYEGQPAAVYIDSQSEPIDGQVGYIADTAEFTPKTVQTDELRTSLVYEVRVYVDDPDNVLRLGMPATVKINL